MIPERLDVERGRERGIALVAAVLIVLLSSVMVATFMTTTTGERTISSNVQTAKISLYAADAGIRTCQQVLANMAQVKLDSCVTYWTTNGANPTTPVIARPDSLFPVGGVSVATSDPPFSAVGAIAFQDSDLTDTSQVYNYFFTIQSTGNTRNTGLRRVQSQGLLRVSAERGSFADYLLFTNTHTMADGSNIWFTSSVHFDGRAHTNTQYRFAYQPRFDDLVTSVNSKAWYYNGSSSSSNWRELNANNNGTTDVPVFGGGFLRGQANVPLPTNTFNQQGMAAGSSSTTTAAIPNSTLNTLLGLGSSTSAPPNGVYVPNTGTGGSVTGGIYIQGNADEVKMWCDTTTNVQYYRVKQGTGYTNITVNRATNQTIVDPPSGGPRTYSGTPRGVMYCSGAVNDLRGPDRSSGLAVPGIAENTRLLLCAQGDIVLQRDLTLDDYDKRTNVLGLYSAGGSVRVGNSAPNDCNLDAFIMATGTSGQFMVDNHNSGSPRGTFHLRGGMVTQYYGAFFTFYSNGTLKTGYARDFHYDRRGLIPPYYPTINRFNADTPIARTLSWKEI